MRPAPVRGLASGDRIGARRVRLASCSLDMAAVALLGFGVGVARLDAQSPAGLEGRVLDAVTEAPVPSAEARLGDERCLTGNDGDFRFGAVTPGVRRLEVRRIGYAPAEETIEILPAQEASVVVRLQPMPIQLDSLVVTAEAPVGVGISGEQLARRGPDLGQALDGWEGVTVRRSGSSGPAVPQVRGSAPDEVLVLLDGFPVNDPLSGRADLSSISSRAVERVTLVPGVQGARAGSRAVAGVILIESRARFAPELFAQAASHGALEGRLAGSAGAVSIALNGQRYADDYPIDLPVGSGGGVGQRMNAGGYLMGLTVRRTGAVEVQLRGGYSRRGLPGIVTNPTPFARAEDGSAFLGARHVGALAWNASFQWLSTRAWDSTPPRPFSPYDSRTSGWETNAGLGARHPAGLIGWKGDAGVALEARYDRFSGDAVRDGSRFALGSLRVDAALRHGTGSVWSLLPVARLDYWTDRPAPLPSARLDAGWRSGGSSLSVGIGSGTTPPVLLDLVFREGVGVRINPNLRPERVRWEVDAALVEAFGPAGLVGAFSVRAYYGRVADMILWSSDFRNVWSPGNFDVLRRGGEASLTIRPQASLRLDGTASLSRVTYDRPGGAQVAYRPLGTLSAGMVWAPGRWSGDLRWHWIGTRFRDNSGVNALPPISLIDLGAQREVGRRASLRFAVIDLSDQQVEFIAGYPTPGRTFTLSLDMRWP